MGFCPECQYLNPNTATVCQSCGAALTPMTVGRETLESSDKPLYNQIDGVCIALGVLVLSTLVVPWIVGTGSFAVSMLGGAQIETLFAFGFPFAEYSYSPSLNQAAWSTYPLVQYIAIPFVLVGGILVIVASLSSRYKNLAITGSLFSALAPVIFLGFSQTSGQASQSLSVSSFATAPFGAILPILFGILAVSRSQKWGEPSRSSDRLSQMTPPQTQSRPSIMLRCPTCGSGLFTGDRFCQTCGANVTQYTTRPNTR
jgi:hypothetical protein